MTGYSMRRAIIDLLSSDLYAPVAVPGDTLGLTFVSPLGWKVRVSGEREHPTVEIFQPGGSLWRTLVNTSDYELDEVLP